MAAVRKKWAKPTARTIAAAVLAVIYLVMVCGPVAVASLRPDAVAHALTGECSGDCSVCGCSPESRASHTCCCSKKAQQQARIHEAEDATTPPCCKKPPVNETFIASCGCPCGDDDTVELFGASNEEILPYHFTRPAVMFCQAEASAPGPLARPHSRFIDPPTPPPRQA